MHRAATQPPTATAAEAELAQRFADALQSATVLPDGHPRLQELASSITESLAAVRGLRLRLRGEQFHVEARPLLVDTPGLTWLGKRLRGSAVGALELSEALTGASLLAFAGALEANVSRAGSSPRFETLWTETFDGIQLLPESERPRPTEDRQAAPPLGKQEERSTRRGRVLAELLEASGEIRARIGAIRAAVEGTADRPLDILGRLVDLLPVEVFDCPTSALGVINTVLDEAQEQVASGLPWVELERKLRNIVFRVSSDHFKAKATQRAAAGRGSAPLDDAAGDEPDVLLREMAELPPAATDLIVDERVLSTERLGVLLHLAINEPNPAPAVVAALVERLQAAERGELQVLRYYLERLLCETGRRNAGLKRIADLMHQAGVDGVVARDCGLTGELAATLFPAAFCMFVDNLDDNELDKIAQMCALVGRERIRAATAELTAPGGILEPARAARILTLPRIEVLPLARILAAKGDATVRAAVITFLQQLRLQSPESAPLYVLAQDQLPLDYVCGLCDIESGGGWPAALRDQAGALLRGFVAGHEADEEIERRVFAIERLGGFPGAETVALLRGLLQGRGPFGIGGRQPKTIRAVAAAVLDRLQKAEDASDA